MVKSIVRALVISGGVAVLTTSTQAVRAAQHVEGFDSRQAHQTKMAFSARAGVMTLRQSARFNGLWEGFPARHGAWPTATRANSQKGDVTRLVFLRSRLHRRPRNAGVTMTSSISR